MQILTKKQKKVLDFINEYTRKNGIAPTIEEIKKQFGLKAVSTVHAHIKSLAKKGFLTKTDNTSRGIQSTSVDTVAEIPVIGIISAGQPIEPIEYLQDTVSFPSNLLDKNQEYYALRVSGNSMQDEGIYDGDTVVLKKQSSAENGQTVVAIIDDGLATLKKI